jgi:hypothetical protein
MKKTPVSLVKERFESKDKLVAAVQKLATSDLWLDRVSAAKGLERVSNAKLVRLHDTLTDAKTRFGSREKLIASIVELNKRVKDKGFASKLAAYPLPQLLDLHAAAARQSKRAEAAAKTAKPKAAKPVKAEKAKPAKATAPAKAEAALPAKGAAAKPAKAEAAPPAKGAAAKPKAAAKAKA